MLSYSHGEDFIGFFVERCTKPGPFIFDEKARSGLVAETPIRLPEVAPPDGGQPVKSGGDRHPFPDHHDYPNARLLRMNRDGLESVTLQDTHHFRIMRAFVNDPYGMSKAMIQD